jgi:hypothetical protein
MKNSDHSVSREAFKTADGEAPLAEDSPESPQAWSWVVPSGYALIYDYPELPVPRSQYRLGIVWSEHFSSWQLCLESADLDGQYLYPGDRLVLVRGEIVVEKASPTELPAESPREATPSGTH